MATTPTNRQTVIDDHPSARAWPGWVICFVVASVVYVATANRGPQWQDSGYHMLRIVTKESVNPLGLALSHPLHHWLGRFVVALHLLEPAFAITILSALAAALAVANVYGCVLGLTSDRIAAALAAASLAVADTFWQLATLTETYTLTAALLAAEAWCLIAFVSRATTGPRPALCANTRRLSSSNHKFTNCLRAFVPFCPCAFIGMFFLNGLGLANHNFALLTAPVLAAVALMGLRRRRISWAHLLLAAAAWLIGSLPYTGLVVAESLRSGALRTTIHSALFGNAFKKDVLNAAISAPRLFTSVAFVALNFPNLLLPAAVYGLCAARRVVVSPQARWALVAALFIHATFALRYSVADQQTFFIPMYLLLVIFGGIGFAALRRLAPRLGADATSALPLTTPSLGPSTVPARPEPAQDHLRLVLIAFLLLAATPVFYAFVPVIARHFDILGPVARHKPYRDDYVYLFTPWSVVERSAERMSREAVDLAGDHGVIIVEDGMAEFAVRYRAIREGKQRIEITRELQPKNMLLAAEQRRPVVLIPRNVERPITPPLIGQWRRAGDLYVLAADH